MLLVYLWRRRPATDGLLKVSGVLLAVLLVQMAVGEIQYRNALPWGLVLAHVLLGATIWTLTVAIVHALWRPPLPLLSAALARTHARDPASAAPSPTPISR